MTTKPRVRFAIMMAVMLCMMGALIWKLSDLTLAEGAQYAELASQGSTTTTYTTGARGRILDRNGVPLAYDETSFNVQFSRDPERLSDADSALYTESLITAIEIIEAGGGDIIDTFYIKRDSEQEGAYIYDWGVTSEVAIYARYKNFCQAMGLPVGDEKKPETLTKPEDAYKKLRDMWKIPPDMPFEQARKIMSIRQEVNMNKWRAYEPITIAYNVPMEVVAQLDMRKNEMMGISTIQSTSRVYPWGATAAHIIGYLSRQVDDTTLSSLERMGYSAEYLRNIGDLYATDSNGEIKTDINGNQLISMTRLGYSYNDYIGVAGVERTMERYLTANTSEQRGVQTLEINKHGTITRQLEKTYAENGNDVMLTIDLQLQQVVESALSNAINNIRAIEEEELQKDLEKPEGERTYKNHDKIRMADSGAIVVMDVNTGKVLAMASFPSFDPNWFLSPIDTDTFELLFGEGSNLPTLNRAIASRMAPGSIFKMGTGLAGLMEGAITVSEEISDHSPYVDYVSGETVEDNAPSCWIKKSNRYKHADLNISEALGVSCNYFFFTVADRIGIERLNVWCNRLGLGSITNIELPGELTGHIGGQSILYNNTLAHDQQKSSLPNLIYAALKKYLEGIVISRGTDVEAEAIESCAQKILQLQDGVTQEYGDGVRRLLLDELGIPITLTRSQNWVRDISSLLQELKWKPTMTIRTGMGQGIASVTPVAVARYAATFVNGGTVYEAHIVDRVLNDSGQSVVVVEPTVFDQIEAPQEYWDAIKQGLGSVISDEDGTASGEFTSDFTAQGYRDQIIGKSGTAQISTAENIISIENTSWFVSYMPAEEPEIVVITCIPYGLSGSRGGIPAVEEITRFYIDRKTGSAKDNLVMLNGIIP